MARAATKTKESPSKAVANWDEQLAKQAETAAAMEANAGGGGQFFSVRAGVLSYGGEPIAGNQMAVVVLDAILEHVFYAGQFDVDNPVPPTCYAFGRDLDTDMAPHPDVVAHDQAVNETCDGCPNGEFGSAPTGRGRACRWTRRLALIPAGSLLNGKFVPETDEDHFAKAAVGYLKVPVTSVKFYAGMVKQVAGVLRRPPHAIFTKITVAPDPKTQLRVSFEPLGPVPTELIPILMKRHQEQAPLTGFAYNLDAEALPPAKPAKRRKY